MMSIKVFQTLAGAGTATSLLLASTSPASAHHGWGWGIDDWHYEVKVDILSSSTNTERGVRWGYNNVGFSNADIFLTGDWTDLLVQQRDYGYGPPIAYSGCLEFWSNYECNRGFAYFTYNMENFSLLQAKWLGCHELGHTVGLGDVPGATNSCMHNQRSTVFYPEQQYFHPHDLDTINAQIGPP